MFTYQNLSLHRKLTLITLLTSSVALLLAAAAMMIDGRVIYRTMLVNNLTARAQVLAVGSTAALSFDDPRPVDEALGALRADPYLIAATVYTPAGKIFAQYVREDRRSGFRPPPHATLGHHFEDGQLVVCESIQLDGRVLGTLCLQRDLSDLDALRERYVGAAGFALLVALGVSLMFSTRLQRTITEPIHHLARMADQVAAEKNYALRAVKRADDELGNLTERFNEMLGKIQAREADLNRAQEQLEARVAERTRELTAALEQLQQEVASRQQAEHRFTQVFRASPVAISITTLREGRFWDANDALLELLDFRREDLIGHTVAELQIWVEPKDRARLVEEVRVNRRARNFECRFRTRTGDVRQVLVSVELIDWGGESSLLFLTHDVTERLNMEMQLRHSQKMDAIGQLAAGVAHDFNNLLTIIRGYTGMMLTEENLPEEMRHPLTEVDFAAERAAGLTRQLLAFSRKQAMQRRVLDFNKVVADAVRMLQRLLGEKTTLQLECAPDLPPVLADPGMLEQVLINLAVNARDAMPQGGRLTITTTRVQRIGEAPASGTGARPGHFVCMGVADTGSGMSAATLARVFEPFFTTKEVGKGSGLGLATVYGIIEQHAGWIEVTSEPGQGTIFQIYLPVAEKSAGEPAEMPGSARFASGAECILVVEDEPALREVVCTILTRHGYRVLTAIHGVDALRVWREQSATIQLLLTDVVMPEGISGPELAGQLCREKPNLKVVYTSGYSVELFESQIELREGNNFLAKPYRSGALVTTVRNCLDAP